MMLETCSAWNNLNCLLLLWLVNYNNVCTSDACVSIHLPVSLCVRFIWRLLPKQTASLQRFSSATTSSMRRMCVFSGPSSSWYTFVNYVLPSVTSYHQLRLTISGVCALTHLALRPRLWILCAYLSLTYNKQTHCLIKPNSNLDDCTATTKQIPQVKLH